MTTGGNNPSINRASVDSYLRKTLHLWLGLHSNSPCQLPKMPDVLERLFLRIEEVESSQRDRWGSWEHCYSDNYWRGRLWYPEVDEWTHNLRCKLRKENVELQPLWPDDKPFAVCLTHDIDFLGNSLSAEHSERKRQLSVPNGNISSLLKSLLSRYTKPETAGGHRAADTSIRSILGALKFKLERTLRKPSVNMFTLDECYKIEKDLGLVASYFFSVYPLENGARHGNVYQFDDLCMFLGREEKVSSILKSLHNEGFDVGLHGSFYSARHGHLLNDQKCVLEETLRAPVTTTRQHWLNWDITKTPHLQSEAGFKADSTLGFNRNIGFRAGTSLPFYTYDQSQQEETTLLQVPLIIQDNGLRAHDALELGEELAMKAIRLFVERIASTCGCLTLLFHNHGFSEPELQRIYRNTLTHCLESNAWVTSLRSIADWWEERAKRLGF